MSRRRAVLAFVCAAACAAPRDAFETAERALLADDLPGALVAFDAVPVSHARYPEARAAALGVERRMRRGHELMLEGLLLRAEWRDDEALASLEHAREVWPGVPGVGALVQATRHRQQTLGAPSYEVGDTAATPPVALPSQASSEAPVAAVALPRAPAAAPDPAPSPVPEPVVAQVDPSSPVVQGLVDVETRLARGELEGALVALLDLASRYPDSMHVRFRLARVLHQRALQRYAQGQISGAISDWERVLAIDPQNDLVRGLIAAVRTEGGSATVVPSTPTR